MKNINRITWAFITLWVIGALSSLALVAAIIWGIVQVVLHLT